MEPGPVPSVPAGGGRETPTRALVPFQWVRVAGPSMVPTLRHGDRVVVRRGARARVGDVVLARFADLPATLVVKRVAAVHPDGRADLRSDNAAAGGDSRVHGPGEVLGRVVLVVSGGRPRRVPPAPDLGL